MIWLKNILLVLLIVSAQPAFSYASAPLSRDKDVKQWMTYYYLHKDSSKVEDFLQFRQQIYRNDTDDESWRTIAIFLSFIFKDNPSQVKGWIEGAGLTGATKKAVAAALLQSGQRKLCVEVFQEDPESLLRQDAFPLINERPESFDDFNGLRVAYSATGDERFVKAIINALDEVVQFNNSKNMSEADQVKDLSQRHKAGFIGSAVPFILVKDMLQHEQVNRLVRLEAMTRSGPIKQVLEKTIALFNGAVLKHSFPNRDGEFSALMTIVSRESWEMIDNVRNFALYTREIKKAKRGDIVSIMFFLSGPSLSQDLFEHVSVDLEVLNKDGGVIDGYSPSY